MYKLDLRGPCQRKSEKISIFFFLFKIVLHTILNNSLTENLLKQRKLRVFLPFLFHHIWRTSNQQPITNFRPISVIQVLDCREMYQQQNKRAEISIFDFKNFLMTVFRKIHKKNSKFRFFTLFSNIF